jgi:hypothetical protein
MQNIKKGLILNHLSLQGPPTYNVRPMLQSCCGSSFVLDFSPSVTHVGRRHQITYPILLIVSSSTKISSCVWLIPVPWVDTKSFVPDEQLQEWKYSLDIVVQE